MTLPANIRVNIGAPFPSIVKGSGPLAVSKKNGIWTVTLNYGALIPVNTVPNPVSTYSLAWDSTTGIFYLLPITSILNTKVIRTLTAPGPYAAQPNDDVLIIKQVVGAAFTVNVDWSLRTKPLRVVDGKGDAAVNNITITPAAGQTQLAQVNYSYVIDGNGGSITLTPLPDNTGAY